MGLLRQAGLGIKKSELETARKAKRVRRGAKCLNTLREGFESRSVVSRVRETARQGRAAATATAVAERLIGVFPLRIDF